MGSDGGEDTKEEGADSDLNLIRSIQVTLGNPAWPRSASGIIRSTSCSGGQDPLSLAQR